MNNRQYLPAINAFIAVINTGSFSQAAKQLNCSQPSISRLINELEDGLGVRLLQRSTRKLTPTEAGTIYFHKVQKIQQDILEAGHSINGFKQTPSGTLRIGAPLHWVDLFITPFIPEFLKLYPNIKLEIQATDEHQDIVRDSLDIVLRVGDPKHVTYIAVPIKPVKLQLCASPSYIEQHGLPTDITQLNHHNCLTYQGFNQWQCMENQNLKQLTANGSLNANLVTILITSALNGLGVTLLPNLLLNNYIEAKQLVTIMPNYTWSIKGATVENMYALYSDRKHLAAKTRAFIDFFKEKIQLIA